MKQFIQYSGSKRIQNLRKYLVLCILCILCCTALSGCNKKEPEVSVLLSSEKESTEKKNPEETEEAEETKEKGSLTEKETDGGSAESESSGSDNCVCVYICGCVKNPDVYRLPPGARICDAVDAAGGMTKDAAENYWNLAEPLADGDMIYIPSEQEAEEREEETGSARSTSLNSASDLQNEKSQNQAEEEEDSGSGLVNLNTADASQLMTLPGIGETRAAAILAYRREHGSFTAISDIKNVSGIGDALFENMKSMITVNE